MCNLTICIKCDKFSWTGCGNHLKQIFEKRVHRKDLCKCDKTKYESVFKYAIQPKTK